MKSTMTYPFARLTASNAVISLNILSSNVRVLFAAGKGLGIDESYISVLPGNFSFFPTVAYQTCLRIKELLDFKEKPFSINYAEHGQALEPVAALVADHYLLRILSGRLDPRLTAFAGSR
jgi:hypothetical protein